MDQVTRSLTNLEDPEAPPRIDQFQFDHDGLGRRISKKINGQIIRHYILDEQNRLVAEALPDGKITTEYVYGTLSHSPDYIIRGPNKYKLVHDQLGSVRLVVNSTTGEIVSKINYDEFGRATERLRPGFQSIGYAGGIRVGINGLYRFGARDYDPSIGRWTSKDPILFNGGDTNLYGYVLGDPVNLIDITGFSAEDVDRIRGGFNSAIDSMNRSGSRRPGSGTFNGLANNASSVLNAGTGGALGNPYYGCADQSEYTMDNLRSLDSLDDDWDFNLKFNFPFHFTVEGRSSNPSDPVLNIDPWRNYIGR